MRSANNLRPILHLFQDVTDWSKFAVPFAALTLFVDIIRSLKYNFSNSA